MDKARFWERQYTKHIERMIGLCYRYVNDRQTAAGLAGGACAWQIARTHPSQTSPAPPTPAAATCPDTARACTKEAEPAVGNRVRRSTEAKPVVVTQEVEVKETVVIRDTDFVKDTIYLFGKP